MRSIRRLSTTPCYSRSRRVRPQIASAKTGLQVPETYKKVSPKGDMVFVKCAPEEVKSLGGILLPGSASRKPTSGTVVELGDGRVGQKDDHKFTLKKGDSVIYSKFGFAYTELVFAKNDHLLIREDEVIGVMPSESTYLTSLQDLKKLCLDPTADDIPKLKPLSDRVLIKVDVGSDVTSGGVVLPDSAKEKPLSGSVVRTGSGKRDKEGTIQPVKVKAGDKVLYFKYAGEKMETTSGEEYVVIHDSDILCKA